MLLDEIGMIAEHGDRRRLHAHLRRVVQLHLAAGGLRRLASREQLGEALVHLRRRHALPALLVDATEGQLHHQDLRIANVAWEAGRGLIVVVNKWDLAEKDDKASAKFEKTAREKAPFLNWVPFLFTSALTGQRVTKILDLIQLVDEEGRKRVSTSQVNERLAELLARRQPSQAAGREVKLNYATQVSIQPPTIAVFGNHPDLVEEHYVRFLHNGFRESWQFTGNPLRVLMRRKSGGGDRD